MTARGAKGPRSRAWKYGCVKIKYKNQTPQSEYWQLQILSLFKKSLIHICISIFLQQNTLTLNSHYALAFLCLCVIFSAPCIIKLKHAWLIWILFMTLQNKACRFWPMPGLFCATSANVHYQSLWKFLIIKYML